MSNLDAKLRSRMRAEIKRLHKRLEVTSIYVTHDQVEAMISGTAEAPIAEVAGQHLPLSAIPDVAERIGSRVTVGIRPEDAEVHNIHEHAIYVELDLVETLGAEALLHTKLGDNTFIIND